MVQPDSVASAMKSIIKSEEKPPVRIIERVKEVDEPKKEKVLKSTPTHSKVETSSSSETSDLDEKKETSSSGSSGNNSAIEAATNAINKVSPRIEEIAKTDPQKAKNLLTAAKKSAIEMAKELY